MNQKLSSIFTAALIKYLKPVDCPNQGSNQHEIGGLVKSGFGQLLGLPQGKEKFEFDTWFIRLTDEDEDPAFDKSASSWYNARNRKVGSRAPEYRLYYKPNSVTDLFEPGDFLLIALTIKKDLLILTAPAGSEAEYQIRTLFGAQDQAAGETFKRLTLSDKADLPLSMLLTERLGIPLFYAAEPDDEELLQKLRTEFPSGFPKTESFSAFARKLFPSDPTADPDASLELWMEKEDRLYHIFEEHLAEQELNDLPHPLRLKSILPFSLAWLNRRKSRAGHALEHHLGAIFRENKIKFGSQVRTEGNKKTDFLFPGADEYHDEDFPCSLLRMLGAKTTCKDRWRQILNEADRISNKHLITMQAGISVNQTDEMKDAGVTLVVPKGIRESYTDAQKSEILTLQDFISEIKRLQS